MSDRLLKIEVYPLDFKFNVKVVDDTDPTTTIWSQSHDTIEAALAEVMVQVQEICSQAFDDLDEDPMDAEYGHNLDGGDKYRALMDRGDYMSPEEAALYLDPEFV